MTPCVYYKEVKIQLKALPTIRLRLSMPNDYDGSKLRKKEGGQIKVKQVKQVSVKHNKA